jgi:hypothetical protein
MSPPLRNGFHPRNHSRLPQAVAAALMILLALVAVVPVPALAERLFATPFIALNTYPFEVSHVGIADITGDQVPDLVWTGTDNSSPYNESNFRVGIFLGPSHNLEFTPGSDGAWLHQHDDSIVERGMAVGDINGDGRADVLTIVQVVDPDTHDELWTSIGTPGGLQFGYKMSIPAVSLGVGDFDGDGRSDVAVARSDVDSVSVFRGLADGSLAPMPGFAIGSPSRLAVGDLNNDGRPDIVVIDRAGGVHSFLGDGAGGFQSQWVGPSLGVQDRVGLADFNGDNHLDLIVSGGVLLGDGIGGFGPVLSHGVNGAFGAGDFNADGRLDLVVVSIAGVFVLQGGGDGTFVQTTVTRDYQAAGAEIAVGDLDQDGHLDLAVAAGQITIFHGNGDGTFGDDIPSFAVDDAARDLLTGDLNGDGRADMALLNQGSSTVSLFLSAPGDTFQPEQDLDTGAVPEHLLLKDLNNDGKLDLAALQPAARQISIFSGNGDGSFGPPTVIPIAMGNPLSLATGDLDEDGFVDLAVGCDTGVWVLFGGPGGPGTSGRVANPIPYRDISWGSIPAQLVVVDFTGDGHLDIARAGNDIDFVAGNGDGTFGTRELVEADHDYDAGYAGPLATVTQDCRSGVFTTWYCCGCTNCPDDYSLEQVLGSGWGAFGYLNGLGGITDQVGDFDGDGAPDLLTSGGYALFGGQAGSRQEIAPHAGIIGDFNGDRRPDLFLLRGSSSPPHKSIEVFTNLHGNPNPVAPTGPWPTFIASSVTRDTIVLGQTFTATLGVRNDGHTSDNGRLSVSFPSFTDRADSQFVNTAASEIVAGGALLDISCNTMAASYLTTEYADADWRGCKTNTVTLTVQPRAAGQFYFYARASMHAAGDPACGFANGLPTSGEAGYTDQQGYPVKRFSVTVLPAPTAPVPVFAAPVAIVSDSIGLGDTFSISVKARNNGAASDDGRIVVGFPSLTTPADSALVSSPSYGDAPGYREFPAGEAVSDSACGSVAASYLTVEYADSDWLWLGTETDTLDLTLRPPAVGTFVFEVRSTMHTAGGTPCAYANAAPGGGKGLATDQQGWTVRRYAITVLPAKPRPTFVGDVVLSRAAVIVGSTFTLTATVANAGADTDDGRIVVSFPYYTAVDDTQWVSATSGGDDTPGYREWPAGTPLRRPNCTNWPANVMSVEYADDAWAGAGAETNQLVLKFHTKKTGTFPIYIRSSMHWAPRGPCAWVDSVPPGLPRAMDQQLRPVGVVWIDVRPPGPLVFPGPISATPASVLLGESFTITATAQNLRSADEGRISIAFPSLTDPNDGASVVSQTTGDAPGYRLYPAGSSLPDSACHATVAGYLTTEYADSVWNYNESNTFTVTVRPKIGGTFYFDVRSTMHDSLVVGSDCPYENGLPSGGVPVIDQQGWTVRRFAVTVIGPGYPLPPPTVAWEPIAVTNAGPGGRSDAAAAFDPSRHAVVVFGGQSPTYQGDAWWLPVGGGSWQRFNPIGTKPTPRILHSMIMDLADDELVIFGGRYDRYLNDVQTMTLTAPLQWIPNPGQGNPPSARAGHAAVYDPVRNRMLVIGGNNGAMLNDVWACSPPATGTWQPLAPVGDPMPGRLQGAAVYDPVRDRVIVIGGDGGALLNDVWTLNLAGDPTWGELHPNGTPPSPRRSHTAIYDPVGDRVIVYGGYDENYLRRGDVWALNLAGEPSWQLLISSTTPPLGRSGHVAVYDPENRRMIMYGGFIGTGQYSSEVWALNLDVTTPVAISLASTDVHSDLVRITWSAEGAANLKATVQRSEANSGEWTDLGAPSASGGDKLVFEDRSVVAGTRYGYRLVVLENGQPTTSDPTWVTVPVPAILSLAGASPNPSPGGVAVRFSLPGNDVARLELFDLRGRRIAAREVGSLGPGDHLVPLSERLNLAAGVYLIRLSQGHRTLTAKACVVR